MTEVKKKGSLKILKVIGGVSSKDELQEAMTSLYIMPKLWCPDPIYIMFGIITISGRLFLNTPQLIAKDTL